MRTILHTGATALGFSFLLTGIAFAASPQEDLVRSWIEGTSFGLEVTIGESSFDPARQAVEMENVRIGRQGDAVVITLQRLTVEDPRRTADGMFAANSIRGSSMKTAVHVDPARWFPGLARLQEAAKADGMDSFDDEFDEDEEEEFSAQGGDDENDSAGLDVETTISKPFDMDFNAEVVLMERAVLPLTAPQLADDATATDIYLTLVKWWLGYRMDWYELNTVTIATRGQDAGDSTTTYGVIYSSGLHDGRIERFGAENMTQSVVMGEESTEMTVGAAHGVGLDLNAMLEVLDPAAYEGGVGDGLWRTVASQFSYTDIRFTAGEVEFTAAEAITKGLRLRQTPKPLLPLYAELLLDPTRIEQDPIPFFRDLLPNLFGLYGLDSMQLNDLQVHAPEDMAFRIGRVDVDKVDSDSIGAITFQDIFAQAGEAGSGALKLLTLNNLRFGSALAWIEFGASMETGGGEPDPTALRDAMLAGMPALDFFELSGLSIDLPEGSIGLDAYTSTSSDYLQQMARRYDIALTRFSMPVSLIPDPSSREPLVSLGYDRIALSGAISAHWNSDTGDFRLLDLTLSAVDVGMISLDLHLGNIPLSILDNPEWIEEKLRDATLVGASATFGNHSIVERVFEMQARQMNQSPETFRKDFAAGMPFMLGMLGDREIQKRFADALKVFFDDPQSIRLSVKPVAPLPLVSLDDLQVDPAEVLKLLNVQVEANR